MSWVLPDDFPFWGLADNHGVIVGHVAARQGTLPFDFNQWAIANEAGWSIAHEAAKYGNLPMDFELWDLADNRGRAVAHSAARSGHLPPDFNQWALADYAGWTVAHEAALHGNLPDYFNQWALADVYEETVADVLAHYNLKGEDKAMIVVSQSAKLLVHLNAEQMYALIEAAGRVCYQSPMSTNPDAQEKFIRGLIGRGHHSVLEHGVLGFKFVTDRGVMAELTRHRLASFSVESTRYCRYEDPDSFKVICPFELASPEYNSWLDAMNNSKKAYDAFLKAGVPPQIARSVLPQCFATTIYMTANVREWRHVFALRTSSAAHPQMRELMGLALAQARDRYPVLFDDL
ncbi:MAG: FAD-dependent thymidylate synthase [Deltaproteobacteria bacterium]|nr:FAD-dependent thymidylate synthase [Deltaproteobacteria bacterium]